ncbi:MAG: GNAT family N-acetyltransferase, partial [Pseudomonadota bacterium]
SWDYSPEFIELCRPFLTVDPNNWGTPQIAEDGALLGYVELHLDTAQLCHLFIAPEAQRRGVGSALLAWATDTARAHGLYHLILNADPNAVPFYEAFGASITRMVPSEIAGARPLPEMKLPL